MSDVIQFPDQDTRDWNIMSKTMRLTILQADRLTEQQVDDFLLEFKPVYDLINLTNVPAPTIIPSAFANDFDNFILVIKDNSAQLLREVFTTYIELYCLRIK